jgi:hypothetical protein
MSYREGHLGGYSDLQCKNDHSNIEPMQQRCAQVDMDRFQAFPDETGSWAAVVEILFFSRDRSKLKRYNFYERLSGGREYNMHAAGGSASRSGL